MTIDGYGTSLATCVLAPNPSPMTLEGTNTWLIAAPGSSSALVVDPGPEDEGHLRRVVEQAAETGRRVAQILLTHGHSDHSAGARRLAALTGAPVRAADPAHRLGSEGLVDGDVVTAAGCELRVIGTPGHSADSLSLLLSQDAALLTGDTVLGRGTTVIADGGSLADYLRSLDAMKALADTASVRVLLPGHGPVVSDPGSTLAYYIAHRAERLAEVRAALAAGDTTAQQIVARVYHDVDPAVRRFAELSVQAQLDYLAAAGLAGPVTAPPSAGALAEALAVDDQHRTCRDLQPAACGKVRECLVDRLPRGPYQLRELFLGQVVVDLKAFVRLLAESFRQVEQRLCDPAGNVGEDQVGRYVVGAAQSLHQGAQHVQRDLRPLPQQGQQRIVRQHGQRRVGHRTGARRARYGIEQRKLAEHLTWPDHAEQILAPVTCGTGQLHLALEHDVQTVAAVTLVEQSFAAMQLDLAHSLPKFARAVFVERFEQRRSPEHLSGVLHRSLLAYLVPSKCGPYADRMCVRDHCRLRGDVQDAPRKAIFATFRHQPITMSVS